MACLPNPDGECTLIRLDALNNGPCVHLSIVAEAEVTSKPRPINMDEMFQKDTKALKGGGRPEADRRTGKGPLKLQTGTSTNLYLSGRFQGMMADTVTLSTSAEQMLSHTRTKRI